MANVRIDPDSTTEARRALYRKALSSLESLAHRIKEQKRSHEDAGYSHKVHLGSPLPNMEKADFMKLVDKAKEHIAAGDIFQVVLSQKFTFESTLPPFRVYLALRETNPSPYLFFLDFPGITLIGSSPEILVQVKGNRVITRPLAGTRPRGEDEGADRKLEEELLNDEKERAEHIMLVDLGRNDLGRISLPGSVTVTELFGVERYSKVMHLVSQVEGTRRSHLDALDVLKALFPAGTVTGAPKIRAMELINEWEQDPRGPYGGAVGYIDFGGNMDTCITIRTLVAEEEKFSIQAGAGVVADSVPEREYEETLHKAMALFRALKIALGGETS